MAGTIRIPAVFVRGGTSRAILFREDALAGFDDRQREAILLCALGSPDPYGRQVDGLGGGISSLSKAAIIGVRDGDVTFRFAQVDVLQPKAEFSGTCGNISSAVGPFALTEVLVPVPPGSVAVVPVISTNVGQRFLAHVPLRAGEVEEEGDYEIDGVPGTGAPIALEFLEPGGSRGLGVLPTGRPVESFRLSDGTSARISIVDVMNPAVFVLAEDVGRRAVEMPQAIDADPGLLARLEEIRCYAAAQFGLDGERSLAIPKVCLVGRPAAYQTSRGRQLSESDTSVLARAISMGQTHRTIPLTMAVCLAAAASIEGTVVHACKRTTDDGPQTTDDGRPTADGSPSPAHSALSTQHSEHPVRIGHLAGVIDISARVARRGAEWWVESATAYRTSRRIMEGQVLVPDAVLRGQAWFQADDRRWTVGRGPDTTARGESTLARGELATDDRRGSTVHRPRSTV